MRIAKDHGKFYHEAAQLPMSEIAKYAAHYIHQHDVQKAEDERIARESKV